jgi:hypothetical protein
LVDRPTFGYQASAFDHSVQEEDGDLLRFALLEAVAGGEVEEGLSGLGDGGDDEAEVGPPTTLRINSLGGQAATVGFVRRLVVGGGSHGW